ncbi:MAG TPA: 6-phosphogluconolactonase [Gammaproteobacteria bacterium]|nr:6-phosphogluconolactonase [Gammaproteobacteria bacterium]
MAEFKVYKNSEAVAQAATDYLSRQIKSCVEKKGICHVVLPGGSTPARCLALLSEKKLPWNNIHWYPGDERCYPIGHAERNDTMIKAKLFTRQENMSEHFHPVPAELGPEQGAENYAELLDAVGSMDIVVLGMGEDGHTASLFPGNIALEDSRSAVPVYDAPKAPDERVSVGLTMLKDAGECIVITTGKNKHDALAKLEEGASLPVAQVGVDVWFVDRAACSVSDSD